MKTDLKCYKYKVSHPKETESYNLSLVCQGTLRLEYRGNYIQQINVANKCIKRFLTYFFKC